MSGESGDQEEAPAQPGGVAFLSKHQVGQQNAKMCQKGFEPCVLASFPMDTQAKIQAVLSDDFQDYVVPVKRLPSFKLAKLFPYGVTVVCEAEHSSFDNEVLGSSTSRTTETNAIRYNKLQQYRNLSLDKSTGELVWKRAEAYDAKKHTGQVQYTSVTLCHLRSPIKIHIEAVYSLIRSKDDGDTCSIVVASYKISEPGKFPRLSLDSRAILNFPWKKVPVAASATRRGQEKHPTQADEQPRESEQDEPPVPQDEPRKANKASKAREPTAIEKNEHSDGAAGKGRRKRPQKLSPVTKAKKASLPREEDDDAPGTSQGPEQQRSKAQLRGSKALAKKAKKNKDVPAPMPSNETASEGGGEEPLPDQPPTQGEEQTEAAQLSYDPPVEEQEEEDTQVLSDAPSNEGEVQQTEAAPMSDDPPVEEQEEEDTQLVSDAPSTEGEVQQTEAAPMSDDPPVEEQEEEDTQLVSDAPSTEGEVQQTEAAPMSDDPPVEEQEEEDTQLVSDAPSTEVPSDARGRIAAALKKNCKAYTCNGCQKQFRQSVFANHRARCLQMAKEDSPASPDESTVFPSDEPQSEYHSDGDIIPVTPLRERLQHQKSINVLLPRAHLLDGPAALPGNPPSLRSNKEDQEEMMSTPHS